jgi:hypothetical protein
MLPAVFIGVATTMMSWSRLQSDQFATRGNGVAASLGSATSTAHLAGAADDEHAFARTARLRGDARLLLMRQRGTDQERHDLSCEARFEPEGARLILRAFQHFTLALIIARRHRVANFVGPYFCDDALAGGDQSDQLAVDVG